MPLVCMKTIAYQEMNCYRPVPALMVGGMPRLLFCQRLRRQLQRSRRCSCRYTCRCVSGSINAPVTRIC